MFSTRLPVSVCGTGNQYLTRSFSWQCDARASLLEFRSPSQLILSYKHLTHNQTYCLDMLFQLHAHVNLLRPSFVQTALISTGISTCFPSATPFGLVLGPDLPWADEPSPGILSLSVDQILTGLSLLIPAFSLLSAPPVLTIWLLRPYNALLSHIFRYTHSFGTILSPGTFSAQSHSTSELLRTLSMHCCF